MTNCFLLQAFFGCHKNPGAPYARTQSWLSLLSFFNARIVYTADLDLVPAGPYYGDFPSNIEDTISSLKRLEKIEVDYYLSAHGKIGIYEGDPKYIRDYLNVIFKREENLLDFPQEGSKTIQEITDRGIIYNNRGHIDSWDLIRSE